MVVRGDECAACADAMGTMSNAVKQEPATTRLVVSPGEVEFRRFRVRASAGPDRGGDGFGEKRPDGGVAVR